MFEIFWEEKVVTVLMLLLFVCSLWGKIMLGCLYRVLIRETDNMSATQNKLLKQCKVKFSNCYQLNGTVANVSIFVDKFMSRLSIGPFSFDGIQHFSGQAMILSVVTAGVGICRSLGAGKRFGKIVPFYIFCFLGLYLYFSVSSIVAIAEQKKILKINLVDYLENHLSARMHTTRSDLEMLYGKSTEAVPVGARRRSAKNTVDLMPINNRSTGEKESSVSEEELESLLKDFLSPQN